MKRKRFFDKIQKRKIKPRARRRNIAKEKCGIAAGRALDHHKKPQEVLPERSSELVFNERKVEVYRRPIPE
jgi:hypothetical protein